MYSTEQLPFRETIYQVPYKFRKEHAARSFVIAEAIWQLRSQHNGVRVVAREEPLSGAKN